MQPVLDSETGILGRLSFLMATGSAYAKSRGGEGSVSQGLWQDLGRAANQLHDLSLDLEAQADEFHLLADTPAPAPGTSDVPGTVPPPPASGPPGGRRGRR